MHIIEHSVVHSFEHMLEIIPLLFILFLILEYVEQIMSKKQKQIMKKSQSLGPLLGSLLGALPQCGFSVFVTNVYVNKGVTIGTLIAVYLSTSDEMLAILLANQTAWHICLMIVGIKIIVGIIAGYGIDSLISHDFEYHEVTHHDCNENHCHCHTTSLLKNALMRTIHIGLLLLCTTILLNLVIEWIGQDRLKDVITSLGFLSVVMSTLIGFIPNCASSVVITQLYLEGAIPLGTMLAGLLSGAGLGWIVLCRYQKDKKKLALIFGYIFVVSVVVGVVINMFV